LCRHAQAQLADVVLQAQDHFPAEGEFVAEGEIIWSSVCCEFGGGCISHAAGAGTGGHCGAAAGGTDEQPLIASVNVTAQSRVFSAFMVQFLGALLVDLVAGGEHFAGQHGSSAQPVDFGRGGGQLALGGVALVGNVIEPGPTEKADNQEHQDKS
jgi:hypothetical protein